MTLLLLLACKAQKPPDPVDDSGGPPPPSSPCATGTWGQLVDPEGAVHVRADGDDAATGTYDAPVATLGVALDLARAGAHAIAVGPGTWTEVELELLHDAGDGLTDDGLVIQGCPGETSLAPPEGGTLARVGGAIGVVLAGFDVAGGTRPLWIWNGAGVELYDLSLADASGAGVVIDGHETVVIARNVTVEDVEVAALSRGNAGYGVVVIAATADFTDVRVSGAHGAGMLFAGDALWPDASRYALTRVSVSDVQPDTNGRYGRGIQVQDAISATLDTVDVDRVFDAGIFILQPALAALTGVGVGTVDPGLADDGSTTTGDGVVITGDPDGKSNVDPSTYTAIVDGSTIAGANRVGLLVDHAAVDADGNTVSGLGGDIVSQSEAVMSGGDPYTEATTAFVFTRAALDGSAVTAE